MMRAGSHRSRISQVAAIAVLVLVYAISAYGQTAVQVVPPTSSVVSADQAKTVTNSSAALLAAGTYAFVKVLNQSTSDTIRCRWGATAIAADTAGQYTILPYSGYIWDASDPPPLNQALNCISSGASTAATVRAF
jgi:hypothetical protein